ncbi:MAG: FadR family transcriptional regulator [Alphaproteobacteria bacterium]|jgi:DNA-binding FadR family transcriptional regulator|nr:FadR family transcriptional regulator [Alphaproteobacteria bacterium]
MKPASNRATPATPRAPQTAVRAQRLGDQLYERILHRIVAGELAEGERLPSEARLCEEFGVSRPVVREALSRLQADGMVVSRQGSGTYVQRRPSQDLTTIAPVGSIADLMRCFEFRIALEGEAAALAALRRTDDDVARIEAALAELDRVIEAGEVGSEADVRFHMAIAQATRNKIFETSLRAVAGQAIQGMHVARSLSLKRSIARMRKVQAEHHEVVAAIKSEDADAARAAMRNHIENARARVLTDSMEP